MRFEKKIESRGPRMTQQSFFVQRRRKNNNITGIITVMAILTRCFVILKTTTSYSFCHRPSNHVLWRQKTKSTTTMRTTWSMRRSFFSRSVITMMPEGPEVKTLVDQLQPFVGSRLIDLKFLSGRYAGADKERPKGFPEFARTMTQYSLPSQQKPRASSAMPSPSPSSSSSLQATRTPSIDMILEWKCKGKFIYIILDRGKNATKKPEKMDGDNVRTVDDDENDFQRSIWITLGMTGRFVSESVHREDDRYARWFFHLYDPTKKKAYKVYYHDNRNFGTLKFCLSRTELDKKLSMSLGPDILDRSSTTEELFLQIVSSQKPELNICKFLMNQAKISGIGNYLLSEGLYKAKIDPFASLQELDEKQRVVLFQQLQDCAIKSYHAQGLTRISGGTFRTMDGSRGNFEFELECYGREVCPKGRPVVRETKGPHGRTIWYTEEQLFLPRNLRNNDTTVLTKKQKSVDEDTKPSSPAVNKRKVAKKDDKKDNKKDESGVILAGNFAGNNDKNTKNNSKNNKNSFPPPSSSVLKLANALTDPAWNTVLTDAIYHSASFPKLAEFLEEEQITHGNDKIYPPFSDLFSAFNLCPFDNVNVVIVGQDPYHQPGQGHGLAFSVRKGVPPPPSLKNIFQEVADDMGSNIDYPPKHGNLESWAKQGVLLLNSVLTVRRGQPTSHSNKGWEEFTDVVIQQLNDRHTGLVFLLWGNAAAIKARSVDASKHFCISTSHPSPLGARKTSSPFLGSRCFSRTNELLEANGRDPIDWNVY